MSNAKSFWLAAAHSYIHRCRYGNSSPRATEFAMEMNRTSVQAAREFRAAVGSTVKGYFAKRQIEHAQERLRTTTKTTVQIAQAAGFGTVRSFYRAFRRHTGCSPTEYRERNVTGFS